MAAEAGTVAATEPLVEEAQPNKVFIANLSFKTSMEQLNAHLGSLNINTTEASLFEDRNGNSKGCAMITLANEADVQPAIDSLTGTSLDERELFARADRGPRAPRVKETEGDADQPKRRKKKGKKAKPDAEQQEEAEEEAPAPSNPCVLYIGNLAWSIDDSTLQDTFSAHGEIVKAEVARERRSDRSQGWGIVEFTSADSAAAATEALNGVELFERQIVVEVRRGAKKPKKPKKPKRKKAKDADADDADAGADANADDDEAPPRRRQPRKEKKAPEARQVENAACHLFVGNLAWDANDDDLLDLFKAHGNVVSAKVVRDRRSERSRGYGTVQMSSPAECDAAVGALNETSFMERDLIVRLDNRVSS